MFARKLGYSSDRRPFLLRLYNRITRIYHSHDLNYELQLAARRESARFVRRHMQDAVMYPGRWALLDAAIAEARAEGLFVEFGVEKGASVNFIARRNTDLGRGGLVHGFDSFEGLPEEWGGTFERRGKFSLQGQLPAVRENVRLHKGWFSDTIPGFLAATPGPVALLHVDCDIYSSTRDVLSAFSARLVPGSIIVFDEFFNYHNWQAHEFRAWAEFVAASGIRFTYRGFAARGGQVFMRVL